MDFLKVKIVPKKDGANVTPEFIVNSRSKDLMTRGGAFYAIWDDSIQMWSKDESDAIRIIDDEIRKVYESSKDSYENGKLSPLYLRNGDSKMIDKWHHFTQKQMIDNFKPLDTELTFLSDSPNKTDYRSKRLTYDVVEGDYSNYDELMSVLFSEDERRKIEWAIGAVLVGDSKRIQKFIILTGDAGTGKSTVIKIIQQLFHGYTAAIDARAIGSSQAAFALEPLKNNPLVAYQDDADLTRLQDNTRLNSLISHENIVVNEKFKSQYEMKFNCFIFLGSNGDVNITDSRSGMMRRVIDVRPSDKTVPYSRYRTIMKNIQYELGAIAYHCIDVYKKHKHDYDKYKPIESIRYSNTVYSMLEADIPAYKEGASLKLLWNDYKNFCEEGQIKYRLTYNEFARDVSAYFEEFISDGKDANRKHVRNYYKTLRLDKFGYKPENVDPEPAYEESWLKMESYSSIFDEACYEYKAQYANQDGKPKKKWDNVTTTLGDLSTQKLHYVQLPEEHIVIDFDIKNEKGEKDKNLNIEAASKWPPTYAEFSKSGSGVHLHYLYSGDVSKLMNIYDTDIEIKKFTGNASLRRQLSTCCNIPIATLSSGLPLKKGGDRKVLSESIVKDEKHLRNMIKKNLRKEIHANTKPSVDFIFKILEDAYNSGMAYDVSDMRPSILAFALNSSNQREACLDIVAKMNWKSEEPSENIEKEAPIVFFDIEVFPNLFLVNYKKAGKRTQIVRLINPEPEDIRNLVQYRLIGFNNRRYDNHILYARLLGYSIEDLYTLSQRIIKGNGPTGMFGEAYNLSYADIYDYSAKKQSLKKWEIELGIHHQELGLPWDQPVPEDMWVKVAEYCDNDVKATEAVFNHLKEDFVARQVLAELSGLTVNDTTRMHATRIIFQGDRHPDLVYTDLSEMFPGYSFDHGKSTYRGEDPSEGGYVYSEPGIYGNVALLDVSSMHPTSMIELNIFGSYTQRFKELVEGRLAVKRKDKRAVKGLLNGVLEKYMGSDEEMDALAYALKIVINSVYGFTAASFDNPFRDPRNKDNIVAKRGALFMIDLKHAVQEKGFTVAHIKTDSIKIPDATPEIIEFVCEFGKKYGYSFEHEATYDKFLLVNDAVYVAKDKKDGHWTATGAEFQHPYIFKKLFTNEPIEFKDLCETKTVTTAIYINMNETLPEGEDNFVFVGRAGSFVPVKPGHGGGELYRQNGDKWTAVGGTKGYRWMEAEVFKNTRSDEDIDYGYFERLVDNAKAHIMEYTDLSWFVGNVSYQEALPFHEKMNPPIKKGD